MARRRKHPPEQVANLLWQIEVGGSEGDRSNCDESGSRTNEFSLVAEGTLVGSGDGSQGNGIDRACVSGE